MRIRPILRIATYAAGAIVVLIALALLVLHTPPVKRYALDKVRSLLLAQNIEFNAASLDYNLLGLSAHLRDVTVRSTATPDLPPIARIAEARAGISLADLIRGSYTIEGAAVRNLEIHLVIDGQGRTNLPRTPEGDGGPGPDIFLARLRVSGGSLTAEDRRNGVAVRLPAWELSVDGNRASSNYDVRFQTAKPGAAEFQGRALPIESVSAAALASGASIRIRQLEIRTAQSQFAVAGDVAIAKGGAFDVELAAGLGLESLTRFAGVPQKIDGALNLRIAAKGPLEQLKVSASVEGDNLTVERFDRLDLMAQAVYDLAAQSVDVTAFSLSSPAAAIDGEGRIALSPRAGRSNLEARVNALDLARLSRTLELPIRIASRAAGTISAQWDALEVRKADARARLRIAATGAPAENTLPVAATLDARGSAGRFAVNIESMDALAGRWTGRVAIDDFTRLGGELRGAIPDLAGTIAAIETFLAKDVVPPEIGGAAELAAKLGGTLNAPAISASFRAPAVQIANLENVDVSADIDYTPRGLAIRDARLRADGQELSARGTIGTARRRTTLDLAANLSNFSIETAAALAGRPELPVAGIVSAEAKVSGDTASPQVLADIRATNLAAYNEPLGTLAANVETLGDVVTVKRLRLEKNGGLAEGSGTYNTATGAFTLDLGAKQFHVGQLALPGGTELRGVFDLAAQGSGTTQDPAITAKLAARDLNVRGQAVGQLNAAVEIANRSARFNVSAPAYNLTAEGAAGIDQPYPADIRLALNGTDLARLPTDQPLKGAITANATFKGGLASWRQGEAFARIQSIAAEWKGQPIRNFDPIEVRYSGGVVAVAPATILAGETRVFLEGKLPLERSAPPGALRVQAYADLAGLLPLVAPAGKGIAASGVLTLDAVLRGSLEAIDPAANLTLRDGVISAPQAGPPVRDAVLTAKLENGAVTIDKLSATWASAAIEGKGEVPLGAIPGDLPIQRRPGPIRFSADIKGLDLAALPGVPKNAGGMVSARVEAEAAKPELAALTARAEFSQLDLKLGSVAIHQATPTVIVARGGIVRIERFELIGPRTIITAGGSVELAGPQRLDLRTHVDTDAALLSLFAPVVRAIGAVRLNAAATGAARKPELNGLLELENAQLSLSDPDIAVQDLGARVKLSGDRLNIESLKGLLNGGALTASGGLSFAGGGLRDVDLRLDGDNIYLNYPQGLRTVSSFDLTFRSAANELVLGGQARILEGSFKEELTLESLLSSSGGGRVVEVDEEQDPTLSRVRFRIDVTTQSPVIVDNTLARLAVTADLDLGGTFYRPGVTGRIVIEEGGELYLSERTYLVERGVITLTSERRLEPSLDILARTEAAGYDISLHIFGNAAKLETTLTSNPDLPEPDILAVLLTGQTLEQVRGSEVEAARNQVLSYLTGRVGGAISREAQRALGLSRVRIEPNLISAESDPSARLTVGQQLTRFLNLVYSMDLTDSSDQIWIAEYDVTRRFVTRAIRQEDNTYRLEFRHNYQFGGEPEKRPERRERPRIGTIAFSGEPRFPRERLLDKLDLKPGAEYNFFKVREGLDDLENMYASAGMLEARVRMEREARERIVDLTFAVQPGPEVEFVFEGWSLPGSVREEVRRLWRGGVFDAQRLADARNALRAALISRGYLKASVEHRVDERAEGRKRVLFEIATGPRYRKVKLAFAGATRVSGDDLDEALEDARLKLSVHSDPGRVTEFLANYYRQQGYLDAQVEAPRYELDEQARTGAVVIPVKEGPLYRVGEIRFSGNTAYKNEELRREFLLTRGEVYTPDLRQEAHNKLQDLYWQKGYRDVEISFTLAKRAEKSLVDVAYQIVENQQSIVKDIQIAGTDYTSKKLVAGQVELQPGQPLNSELVSKSRRNLYDVGAFNLVDIETVPAEQADGLGPNQVPVRLDVRVKEVRPFSIRYGGFFDTERGPGAVADFSTRNTIGGARVLGLVTRYDADLHEGRLYFSQPLLRTLPLRTDAAAFVRRELREAFITDRIGTSVQQETRFGGHYVLTYGYRLEQAHTFDRVPSPDFPFDITVRVAPFRSTLTRETRNDFLDSTRGSFTSHAFEYGTRIFGSELSFMRYYGQYSRYVSLGEPMKVPFSSVPKTRLVYAGGVRLGLAGGLGGQVVVPSERFFAGGGTTIRGFKQDTVGPLDSEGNGLGGNAVFIMNHELRFPIWSVFDGVGFLDIGNVYPRIADFDILDVRKAAGFGLRLRTPYVLLRLDYGVKLDRKPGEGFGRLFFSIGQAF